MNCIHDGQKTEAGNRDMLRRLCESACRSIVCRGGIGAMGL